MVEWERELWFHRENCVSWFGNAAESQWRTAKQTVIGHADDAHTNTSMDRYVSRAGYTM